MPRPEAPQGKTPHKAKERPPADRVQAMTERSVPVVGIGYSAGGLAALTTFLDELGTPPGLALIAVQHVHETDSSRLPELLRSHTGLHVETAADGAPVEAGHLYLAAPGRTIRYVDGHLIAARPAGGSAHHDIDVLLRSLARGLGPRCAGMILSGSLWDGVEGMQEIRRAGGRTLVQEPGTAQFPHLPKAVIEAGAAESVLDPAALAAEVARLAPELREARGEGGLLVDEAGALDAIHELLRSECGVDFRHYKHSTLGRRIDRRMTATRSPEITAYARLLRSDRQEVRALYKDLLIHVTGFFRDEGFYQSLQATVIAPMVQARARDAPIRVWVPGCSTGEEVYSIGILLVEAMEGEQQNVRVQIFGTDLSDDAIRVAREGVYSEEAMKGISPERRARFFEVVDDGFRVGQPVRDMCLFAVHDLTRDPPFSNIDILSCRNVLIYMDTELQKQVFATLHYALRPDGFLAIGPSEGRTHLEQMFAPVADAPGILGRREVEARAPMPQQWSSDRYATHLRPGWTGSRHPLTRVARETVASRYDVVAMAFTPDGRMVWSQGDTDVFLGPKAAGRQEMHVDDLPNEVQAAVQEAARTGGPVNGAFADRSGDGTGRRRAFDAAPLKQADGEAGFLVVAQGASPEPARSLRGRPRAPGFWSTLLHPRTSESAKETARLRRRLQDVVEDYEATTEELRSANEEALSINEELQSTNEELETAREELQSTNEELATLNEELHLRNEEVQAVRDELLNLVHSLGLAIVTVGADLRIRRFTTKAAQALNLIASDVGRPLTDLNTGLDAAALAEQVERVVHSMQAERTHVTGRDGAAYGVTVSPLRTEGARVEGVVLILAPSGS